VRRKAHFAHSCHILPNFTDEAKFYQEFAKFNQNLPNSTKFYQIFAKFSWQRKGGRNVSAYLPFCLSAFLPFPGPAADIRKAAAERQKGSKIPGSSFS
jgi:hypothetical protein